MNQSEFLAITCNLLKEMVQGTVGLGFASRWLKNSREILKPITKRSNHSREITLDTDLKSALNCRHSDGSPSVYHRSQ